MNPWEEGTLSGIMDPFSVAIRQTVFDDGTFITDRIVKGSGFISEPFDRDEINRRHAWVSTSFWVPTNDAATKALHHDFVTQSSLAHDSQKELPRIWDVAFLETYVEPADIFRLRELIDRHQIGMYRLVGHWRSRKVQSLLQMHP